MWWDVSMRPALRTYATQARGAESIVRRAGGGGRDRSRSILPTAPLPPYRIWLKNGAKAFKYPKPRQGPHWLAETPFPLNPTFSPQPPVHQSVRDDMWQLHTQDAKQWTVRALSAKFRVSMERTEAILRLKALEDMYTQQGKPLQTELQRNMERLLGSRPSFNSHSRPVPSSRPHSPRGAPYEELSEGVNLSKYVSPLVKAIRNSNIEHRETMRHLPTGGPTQPVGARTVDANRADRAPLRVVTVGPDSYAGIGTLERNKKRAAHRKKQRAKRREKKLAEAERSS